MTFNIKWNSKRNVSTLQEGVSYFFCSEGCARVFSQVQLSEKRGELSPSQGYCQVSELMLMQLGSPEYPALVQAALSTTFGVTWKSYNNLSGECPLVTTASLVCSLSQVLFHSTEHRISLQGGKSHWPKIASFLVSLRRIWQKGYSTHLLEFLVLDQKNSISE